MANSKRLLFLLLIIFISLHGVESYAQRPSSGSLTRSSPCPTILKNTDVKFTNSSGNPICTTQSSNTGSYPLCSNLPNSGSITINPVFNSNDRNGYTKYNFVTNGVTTYDLYLLSAYFAVPRDPSITAIFADPFIRLAADANNNGQIDNWGYEPALPTNDILIIRRVILRVEPDFNNSLTQIVTPSWRFVPQYFLNQFSFSSTFYQDPFFSSNSSYAYNGTNSYMDKVTLDLSSPSSNDVLSWTFRPFKVGDLNCNFSPAVMFTQPIELTPREEENSIDMIKLAHNRYKLQTTLNISLQRANEKTIVLKAKNAGRIASFQIGMRFLPSKLSINNIETGDFNTKNDVFDFSKEDAGALRALWYHDKGEQREIQNGTILLKAKVKANANIDDILTVLNLDDSILQGEFADVNGNPIPMDLEWAIENNKDSDSKENSLIVNTFPNPFNDKLTFEINAPVSGKSTITISNIITKQNIEIQKELIQGLNTITIDNTSAIPMGMLTYTIRCLGNQVANGLITKIK